ncbi:hypothetical protein SELMODRAFT_173060 [Selaginella moellendorffii]|uniref:Cyclin-like domain-containing protein n=1 Tax=Selaginella moellendorffii TaxID=88036 RepID=D8RNW9_SELML|nr:cyclin-C1-1 [Selaginella moellendorffii]XP_002988076.1 cyclin-C1-1 [Selaginella moellendorffii]EFJ10868.1 hypothetical protein SELMODRAFT_183532 [Selaginella moellendorffii]EFJ25939.1 hypothetical protein SELMODRAFT_173060 [Selaginella moellendorffii]|eukprot:XP_002972718.1 cyclin-C1-1 [Selaginella moellendorffii]
MAANFWTSSHCKRLLEQEEISVVSNDDRDRGLTQEDVKIIKIYFSSYIKKLAQRAKVRQRVVATAIAYFRRVYTRKSFSEYDPRLVAPTCLYLASKAEESTVQAKLLIFYMKQIGSDENGFRYDIKDILEMEMKLLEALDYYLVIYHPYRPLVQLLRDAGLSDMIEMCWSIVNDSYGTDLILMHPPYMIALACIYISCVINERDNRLWFEESRVDMTVIKNIAMQIFDFYDNYRLGFEDRIGAILLKLSQKS